MKKILHSYFIYFHNYWRTTTNILASKCNRDRNGFTLTGPDLMPNRNSRPQGWTVDREPFLLETNIPGVFAAGDVRLGSIKRVASGVGEGGATAIQFVHQYLTKV
jgi:thioredoxin reductase (NADPH)